MDVRVVVPSADDELAGALLRIQRAAYAAEARLIGDGRIPHLHEDLDDLCSAPLTWLAAKLDDAVAGAVAWTRSPDEADIDRLIVSPVMHRQGIGSALIREVLRRERGRRILVSTGRCNAPARALYESLGFVPVGDQEVLPGLWTTRYEHSS